VVLQTCDIKCDELAADWTCVDGTAIATMVSASDVTYL